MISEGSVDVEDWLLKIQLCQHWKKMYSVYEDISPCNPCIHTHSYSEFKCNICTVMLPEKKT